ncbi:hypothetical protein CR513_31941, partial [Mucuna pruriens]
MSLSRLVEKLALPTLPHPKPYKLKWLSEKGELVVNRKVSLAITLGSYKDNILYVVVSMEATHIFLVRPWQFDRKVTYDGVIPKPLSPREICKDQIKMRIKREEERKEKKDSRKG